MIAVSLAHLGTKVQVCSGLSSEYIATVFNHLAHPEISKFDFILLIDKYVFKLNVPMHDLCTIVAVFYR